MKRLFSGLVVVFLCSCSPKTWFTSDSDAYFQYDRVNQRWEMIWTWKMKKGQVRTDTIPILDAPVLKTQSQGPSGGEAIRTIIQ